MKFELDGTQLAKYNAWAKEQGIKGAAKQKADFKKAEATPGYEYQACWKWAILIQAHAAAGIPLNSHQTVLVWW